MICPKCGRMVPDGSQCPCGAPVLSSNPAVNLLKTIGSSPKFLTAVILYTVMVVFNILYNSVGVTLFNLRSNLLTLCTRDQKERNQVNLLDKVSSYLLVGTTVTLVVGSILYYTMLHGYPASNWYFLVGAVAWYRSRWRLWSISTRKSALPWRTPRWRAM